MVIIVVTVGRTGGRNGRDGQQFRGAKLVEKVVGGTTLLVHHHGHLGNLLLDVQEELGQEGDGRTKHLHGQVEISKRLLGVGVRNEHGQIAQGSVENGRVTRRLSQLGQRLQPLDEQHGIARGLRSARAVRLGMLVHQVVDAGCLQVRPSLAVVDDVHAVGARLASLRRLDELKHRFGLDAAVVTADLLAQHCVMLALRARALGNGRALRGRDLGANLVSSVAGAKALSRRGNLLLAAHVGALGVGPAATSLIGVVNTTAAADVLVAAAGVVMVLIVFHRLLRRRRRSNVVVVAVVSNLNGLLNGLNGADVVVVVVLVSMLVAIAVGKLGGATTGRALGSGSIAEIVRRSFHDC